MNFSDYNSFFITSMSMKHFAVYAVSTVAMVLFLSSCSGTKNVAYFKNSDTAKRGYYVFFTLLYFFTRCRITFVY